ncbi:UNVERIFIED_ORG: hypothetical protein B2H93_16780 [Clostridium botulinum]
MKECIVNDYDCEKDCSKCEYYQEVNEMYCNNCGFEEDELYEVDSKKYCEDCLESLGFISIETTKTYYVNGEIFEEDEFEDAMKYLGAKIIK